KVLFLSPEDVLIDAHNSVLRPDSRVEMLTADVISTLWYGPDYDEEQLITQRIDMSPDIKLIVIGPLTHPTKRKAKAVPNAYSPGYSTLEGMRAIANKHHIAVLLYFGAPYLPARHHEASLRRFVSRNGLFDSALQLHHQEPADVAHLLVARRGNSPLSLDLTFRDGCGWFYQRCVGYLGKTWESTLSSRLRVIYEIMHQSPTDVWTAVEIANRTGIPLRKIHTSLSIMTMYGYIERVSLGYYRLLDVGCTG
ncbi:MAG TPA: hypothetical protein VHV83_20810, partial [Armatimonadota bacterium]|nr:hypothetical protein [Armatimonadota bacterium]